MLLAAPPKSKAVAKSLFGFKEIFLVGFFLNHSRQLNLSAADIAALEQRTEGWIAGLQLAALSMRGLEDRITSYNVCYTKLLR